MTEAVLVTGASSGIGEDAARALARRGFVVYAGVRNDADAARVATLHENVRPVLLDVTDATQIAAAAQVVRERGVPLRALVNNAGVPVAGPLEYLPVEDLRRQFEINVVGQLAVTQAMLPFLRATRGRLVFIGSASGRITAPFLGPYSASKFALRALTDALRLELRTAGIAVSLIEPGSVKTPIWRKGRESRESLLTRLPAEAHERYGAALEKLFAATMHEEQRAMPVETVTAAVVAAITSANPRANAILGAAAKAGAVLAMLPIPLRDRAIRASVGLR
ncbi:MAG TPA: SDR family oxidoreductase [Candidatus Baltobacteraceae bacterium]|nr:SDR family oxidoreductase [Candidatus Baltobacteraceae bacterium]